MSFLEINDINVLYGDVQVIFDLSLRINEGEVVSIIGGNGAGKSTLLKTISGLVQSSGGNILFENRPVHELPPEKIVERGIVHVPEGRRLFKLMTVLDNLIIGAYNSKADHQKNETLQDVYSLFPWVQERCSQLAMTLSGASSRWWQSEEGSWQSPSCSCWMNLHWVFLRFLRKSSLRRYGK